MFSIFQIKNLQSKIANLVLLFTFSLFSLLFAGAPDTLWTRTYGGDSTDIANEVQQTNDGGFIIAGYTYSFGIGESDVYIIRTDSNGDTIWTKTYGGSGQEYGNSVQQTSDGGFIIAGETGPGLNKDVYLIKTNSNGDTLWTKKYGGNSNDVGSSVQQTNGSGFIIAGFTESFGSGDADVYLIRTDFNGDTLWTRTYGGTTGELGFSVQQTSDGGFVVAGYKAYLDSLGITKHDVYLISTDSNGDTLWTKTYGGNMYDWGYSVQQTRDYGFIIAGSTNSFGLRSRDVYLIRTNANGDTLWTKTYGRNSSDFGYSVLQMKDGGFIISGRTYIVSGGGDDVYLIRTDSNGDTLWTKTIGGNEWEVGKSIQQTSDGGYIIAGSTISFGAGGSDVYLIRLDKDSTAIQQETPSNFITTNNFIVSYNNGNTTIRYTIPHSSSVKLEAYDIKGKLVKVITDKFMQKGSYSVNWDSKRFGSGVYFLKLSSNGSAVSKKFTIIK